MAIQQIHDHVVNMPTAGSLYVISLSFSLLRVITRLMTKYSLECCRCTVDTEKKSPTGHSKQSVHELLPLKNNSKLEHFMNNVNGSPLFLPPSLLVTESEYGLELEDSGGRTDKTGRDDNDNITVEFNSQKQKYLTLLKQCLLSVVELCFDGIQESFGILISSSFDNLNAVSNQPGTNTNNTNGNSSSGGSGNSNNSSQQRNSIITTAPVGIPTCGISSASLRMCIDIFGEVRNVSIFISIFN